MREAMHELVLKGILHRRPGSGTFIVDANRAQELMVSSE